MHDARRCLPPILIPELQRPESTAKCSERSKKSKLFALVYSIHNTVHWHLDSRPFSGWLLFEKWTLFLLEKKGKSQLKRNRRGALKSVNTLLFFSFFIFYTTWSRSPVPQMLSTLKPLGAVINQKKVVKYGTAYYHWLWLLFLERGRVGDLLQYVNLPRSKLASFLSVEKEEVWTEMEKGTSFLLVSQFTLRIQASLMAQSRNSANIKCAYCFNWSIPPTNRPSIRLAELLDSCG